MFGEQSYKRLLRVLLKITLFRRLLRASVKELLIGDERQAAFLLPTIESYWADRLEIQQTFDHAAKTPRPSKIEGFEDLYWLFTSNRLSRGIVMLQLDEAAYIYRLVNKLDVCHCVELGRYKGGGTFLIAAAAKPGSKIISVDNYIHPRGFDFIDLERSFLRELEIYNLRDRVELFVEDTKLVPYLPSSIDFIFVDANHSYDGVRGDYIYWQKALKPGGHLLFHDAAIPQDLSETGSVSAEGLGVDGPMRLVSEIEAQDYQYFRRAEGVASIVHFVRTDVPLP